MNVSERDPIAGASPDGMYDIVQALTELQTSEQITQFAFEHLQSYGAVNYCYAHAPPLGAPDYRRPAFVDSRALPVDWGENYYKNRFYENDPISKVALSQLAPFFWSDVAKLKPLSHGEMAYLERLKAQDMSNGVCIPAFGPRGRNGYFGIGMGTKAQMLSPQHLHDMQWFCQNTHLRYCAIIAQKDDCDFTLSKREIEVLRLVLVGQSNKDIARSLSISTNSAATYLTRAHEKLETSDRFSAATRALALGLLD